MAAQGTPFVVLTTQRNGSTWVMSVLNSLDGVSGQGELFLPRPRSPDVRWDSGFAYPRYVESHEEVGRVRPFSVFRYLDRFYRTSPGAVGFKLMYSQVRSYPETLAYLVRRRIPVVHLVRRNHLDVLISFAVKREIGRAHILTGGDRPANVRVELPTESLVRDLERLQRKHDVARKLLRGLRLTHLEVSYEQLAADPGRFDEVLEFLDLPTTAETARSNIVRTRTGSQRDVVTNYDDVRRVLEGTGFAALLDE
jgi:LPS sulfotransferase NodH